MTVKFTFAMTDANVTKGIADIGKRAKSVRVDMHKIACSILHNWAKHGAANVAANRATELLENADGAHAQKIVNWFAAYGGLELDGEEFVYTETTMTTETYQAAKAEDMFTLTPDAKPEPAFDLRQRINKLVAEAKKRRVNGVRENVDDVPADLISAMEALVKVEEAS